jgi:hypothetical protein
MTGEGMTGEGFKGSGCNVQRSGEGFTVQVRRSGFCEPEP